MSDPVADHVHLSRLQSRYADVINRRAWGELGELFEERAPIRIDTVTRPPVELTGPAELAEFVGAAVERFAFFEFVILSSHVELPDPEDPDSASARLYMCEVRRDAGSLDWSTAFGVYHDRYRRGPQGWRFSGRDYQSLTRTGGPVFPFPHHLSG